MGDYTADEIRVGSQIRRELRRLDQQPKEPGPGYIGHDWADIDASETVEATPIKELQKPAPDQAEIDAQSVRVLRATSYGISYDEYTMLVEAAKDGPTYDRLGPEIDRALDCLEEMIQ